MTTDPPIRDDGRCALEACGKPIKAPKRRRDVPERLYADPFCSTDCCKAYFGVAVKTYSESYGRDSAKGRQRDAA